jgi:histidinol-phosphate phosphatase family protein
VTAPAYSVVIPTVGRPSLRTLVESLQAGTGPAPVVVVVVDDRAVPDRPLDLPVWDLLQVVPGPARGPAAARNVGWRATATPWVAFLDDDVRPGPGWAAGLAADLAGLAPSVAGSQGRLRVPLPAGRRPTDWERVTAGLETARWATADMAFRRTALVRVGGFDERFGRAYREDADLALRLQAFGWSLVQGERAVDHPVRPASRWVSVRSQAGNADDALMRRLHGSDWRRQAGAPRGRLPRHAAVTIAAATALAGLAGIAAGSRRGRVRGAGGPAVGSGRGWVRGAGGLAVSSGRGWACGAGGLAVGSGRGWARSAGGPVVGSGRGWARSAGGPAVGSGRGWARSAAVGGGMAWLAGTAEFAAARIAPGPRTPREILTMVATSAAIPPAAVAHRLRGELSARRAGPLPAVGFAVLFDRDGTLVHDVPYNGDPALVDPVPGALAALARLRAAGVPVGVVTNQSGIGRGRVSRDQVDRVNDRVEELLGPFDTWQLCPHAPDAGCACRKPEPGLVLAAASALGVPPSRCVVIGDVGADVAAARAAGAGAVLVPTAITRPDEVRSAPAVAADLPSAVDLALAILSRPLDPTRSTSLDPALGRALDATRGTPGPASGSASGPAPGTASASVAGRASSGSDPAPGTASDPAPGMASGPASGPAPGVAAGPSVGPGGGRR